MVMKILKDTEPKISGIWNQNPLINPYESDIVFRPTQILEVVRVCMEELYSRVSSISNQNVLLKLLNIHGNNTTEYHRKHAGGTERSRQLRRRTNRTTIVWINCTIRLSLPFWIKVRMTSESIRFGPEAAWPKSNNHVETG